MVVESKSNGFVATDDFIHYSRKKKMAPDPRGSEDSSVGPMVIAGNKISLNVHYGPTETAGTLTPVETSNVMRTSSMVSSSSSSNTQVSSTKVVEASSNVIVDNEESVDKVTHIDTLLAPVPIEASSPSPSAESSSSNTTPETTSAHSEEQTIAPSMYKKSGPRPVYRNGPDQIIPTEDLKAWEKDASVKIRIGDSGLAADKPISVPSMFLQVAKKYGNHTAMAVKRDGVSQTYSYKEYYDQCRTVAKAFIKLGLERFHGVCIMGFNSPEWFISDMAAIFAGGCAAGIYTTNSADACQHCAQNCEAQIYVVEDHKQLEKVLKIRGNLPHLKTIIQYSGKPTVPGVLSWDEVLRMGHAQPEQPLEERLSQIAINQCCTLIYTSGTTGPPKGVMLNHDNLVWTAKSVGSCLNFVDASEVALSYLPLSHVAAQMADIYVSIATAATVHFAQPDALKGSLGVTLKEVRPTAFLGVPRVWEKFQEKMLEVGRKTKGVKKSIATWAKSVGLEKNVRYEQQNFNTPFGFGVANAIIFKKIKAALGLDRCKIFLSGAAPIAPEVVKYFHSLNIPLTEIYGMSESSGPHTICLEKSNRFGSAGRTLPGCNLMLAEPDREGNGEICMGGRNISMGYLLQEEKTHETIDDQGWLHSGDIGRLDAQGFLFITGRIKELIITAGGENIPPVLVEDTIKSELPCISNAMLIGDKRKFLCILLTLKTDLDADTGEPLDTLLQGTVEWCRSVGSQAKRIQDVLAGPDAAVMRAIQDGIDRANKQATSNAQRVQKWTILPRDFSIPGDELGPTMKLKRPVVNKKYHETIERFYA